VPLAAIICLKVILIFFPLAWFLGLFPPVDAFLLWLLEQCYIYIYGGNATATSLRLFVQLTVAVALSVVVNFIPSDIACVALLASFGYILSSVDFMFIVEWLHFLRTTSQNATIAPVVTNNTNLAESNNDSSSSSTAAIVQTTSHDTKSTIKVASREFPINWKDWLFHLAMFTSTLAISLIVVCVFNQVFTSTAQITPFLTETVLLYICVALFILCKVCGDFQSVYWFYGLVRNPFYPKEAISTEVRVKSKSKKKKTPTVGSTGGSPPKQYTVNGNRAFFKYIRYFRIVLLRICAPLILCAVIAIDCHLNKVYNDKVLGFWRILIVLRAFRWVSLFSNSLKSRFQYKQAFSTSNSWSPH
jgi:hypothetical protein